VVSNLLSNALKFTRQGRVDLRVALSAGGIRILVSDTGIGIAEDAQTRIFQPFIQAGAGIARQFGGTGLGLTLTRRLCEAMDGQLTLSSQEGVGSQFSATLPLPTHAPAARWPALPGQIVALCANGSGLAELLDSWLPAWGLGYRRLDESAISAELQADLLICDDPAHLPRLRQHLASPLLLVSAYGTFISGEQAGTLIPFEQLPRPLARAALYQALQRLLAPHQTQGVEPAAKVPSRPHQARVLLVEDNQVNQMVAKGMLSKLGCEVAVTAHGGEAIAYLEKHPVDLVLMDCNMPVMDGYEATRRIRQSGHWPNLPIIALTANALPDERERCQAAGMNDYLAKPFRREDLAALLDSWLPVTSVS
jgi:CheY-like chemotaxis protein